MANEPVIKYGAMQGKSRARFGKWLLSRAHIVIAVSKSNKREIINNACVSINKIKLIYNAIPDSKNSQNIVKKNIVLTVGEINKETFKRKGLDRFIAVAKKMPNVQFIHIGKWTNNKGIPCETMIRYVKKISSPNIQYLGYVNTEVLRQYYLESKVYLQLSRHEAFGISVVEAMSYNCTPIVTNSYALPEIVQLNGIVVKSLTDIIHNIKSVLLLESNIINYAFISKYSVRKRRDSFKKII